MCTQNMSLTETWNWKLWSRKSEYNWLYIWNAQLFFILRVQITDNEEWQWKIRSCFVTETAKVDRYSPHLYRLEGKWASACALKLSHGWAALPWPPCCLTRAFPSTWADSVWRHCHWWVQVPYFNGIPSVFLLFMKGAASLHSSWPALYERGGRDAWRPAFLLRFLCNRILGLSW